MDQSFAPWFNKYRKKATILEIRSGKGKQSIVPGSIIDDELVEWNRYIEPEEYSTFSMYPVRVQPGGSRGYPYEPC